MSDREHLTGGALLLLLVWFALLVLIDTAGSLLLQDWYGLEAEANIFMRWVLSLGGGRTLASLIKLFEIVFVWFGCTFIYFRSKLGGIAIALVCTLLQLAITSLVVFGCLSA